MYDELNDVDDEDPDAEEIKYQSDEKVGRVRPAVKPLDDVAAWGR